jgi:hypothetical protein
MLDYTCNPGYRKPFGYGEIKCKEDGSYDKPAKCIKEMNVIKIYNPILFYFYYFYFILNFIFVRSLEFF